MRLTYGFTVAIVACSGLLRSIPADFWKEHGPNFFAILGGLACLAGLIQAARRAIGRLGRGPSQEGSPPLASDHPLWDRPLDG